MNKKFFIRLIMLLILMIIIDMGLISINHYSMAWTETGEFSDYRTEGIIYNEFDHSSGNKYLQIRSTSKEMLQQMINQMCWREYISWSEGNVNTDILGTIYQVEGEDSVYYFSLSNYYFIYMLEHQPNFNSFVFDGDLGDIAELPNFSCWKNVKIITFINYNIDDLTGFDLAYDNGYLKNITDIYFGNSRASEKNDSILKQNKINLYYLTTISSSSERNVNSLQNAAEGCWETIVNGNFNYGVGMVPVIIGQSVRRVDCSSFVSTILYRYGYQGEFLGKQHTTLDFYNTNWNSKYGWREIYVNGGESFRNKGLQAGDIIVRDNGSGKGHMAYVKEVRSDGIPILYDCGDTPHWSKSNINGYTSDSSMAFIDGYSYGNGDLANVGTYPGKIIRIENQYPNNSKNNNSKNNNSKNNNSKTNNNGNNKISTITYYTLNTVVDLSYADEYSKSKTFYINASLSGGNVNDCEIYVNANRIGNNNGHAEYTIYSNWDWDPINIEIIYNRNGVILHNTHTYWVHNIDNEGPSSTIWYAFENGKDYMYVKGEDNQELKELRVYDGNKKLINSKSIDNQGYTSYQTRFEVPKNGKYYLIVEDHAGNKTSWGSGYNITTRKP